MALNVSSGLNSSGNAECGVAHDPSEAAVLVVAAPEGEVLWLPLR